MVWSSPVALLRLGVLGSALLLASSASGAAPDAARTFQEQVLPLLKSYCYDCHGGGAKEGNLALDSVAANRELLESPDVWWKVLKNLRAGLMPPADEERPKPEEIERIAQWIKFDVFRIRPDDVDPGRASVRRLNRREYGNTVRELMGADFDAAVVFPADDSGHGFDNVGDALSFSPLLLEKYLRAAQTIVDQAVPKVTWMVPRQEFSGRDFEDEEGKVRGDSMSSKTAVRVKRLVHVDDAGKYAVEIAVKLRGSFDFDPSRYTVVFSIDGQPRSKHEYGWDENKLHRYQFNEEWQAGEHELAFELIPLPSPAESEATGGFSRDAKFVRFEVNSVRIEGPLGTGKLVHPRNYAKFFPRESPPASHEERRQYAEEILRAFATRAFRGSVDQATIDRLLSVAEKVFRQPDKTFEAGVAHAMVAVLASPRFLFHLESTPRDAGDSPYLPIDELTLASRLSYFLWSSMPDDELFALAQAGQLRKQLPQQVTRLMRDDRADEFVRNFAGQWLRTRDVTQVSIDPIVVLGHQAEYEQLIAQFRGRRSRGFGRELTPEEQKVRDRFRELRAIADRFNDELKQAMRRETEMCVEYIAREDRSLLELLDSDYTFLNEKLAELYGIPDVRGNEMRRVELPPDSPRGGVLTQASMLLVTSNPTRTSPVKRGLFVLENILGTPAPPAPAGVPDLEESAKKFAGREPTLRELLAAHRESPLCASCHARMDPLGIALENFNALGMWRDDDKRQPIEASGKLITGEEFQDARELKKILKDGHAADFYRCVTQKMLTYALGRGLDYTDEHTVDLIVERLARSGGRFSDLLYGVIESAPFQKQRNPQKAEGAKS
jgi:hypothetical protein